MGVVLDAFFKDKRLLPDEELTVMLGWSFDTLKQMRVRREAPPSLKVRAIHLTSFDDLEKWMLENGQRTQPKSEPKSRATADLLK